MENKGASLNKRVWKLFGEAGFTTKPNTNDSDEHVVNVGSGKTRTVDLLASDTELDVTIVGSNKSGKIDSWTAHVTDFEGIRKAAKANKLLFVVTGKDLTPEDLAFAKARNASVWTAQDLKYYEALVATIGRYAKFEILHNLGVRTKEEDNVVTLIALRTKQPFSDGPCELYTFTMSPENLLKTCVVYRKALDVSGDNAKAYQRMINKQRLPKIAEYVSKRDSILPVNIIVDLKAGRIAAVIIRSGRFFWTGGTLHAVPPTELQLNETGETLQLAVSRSEFAHSPDFNETQWPNYPLPGYAAGSYYPYRIEPYNNNMAP